MSLAEIETAAEALSLEEKRRLLEFLAARINGSQRDVSPVDLANFAGALLLSEDPVAWQQRVRGEWK